MLLPRFHQLRLEGEGKDGAADSVFASTDLSWWLANISETKTKQTKKQERKVSIRKTLNYFFLALLLRTSRKSMNTPPMKKQEIKQRSKIK